MFTDTSHETKLKIKLNFLPHYLGISSSSKNLIHCRGQIYIPVIFLRNKEALMFIFCLNNLEK
jgi:hypothetical protein